MSLIIAKTGFNGPCDEKHKLYQPFYNAKAFLNKPLTPYGQATEAQNVDEYVEENVEHANVDDMGHVNIDEDAYGMPPPPLLQFISCSHRGSLQLDTFMHISLISNS
jgi:hypothetical protein